MNARPNQPQPKNLQTESNDMQTVALEDVDSERASHLIARVRNKQLEAAMNGQVLDSARHAQRAERIGRMAGKTGRTTSSDCSCN